MLKLKKIATTGGLAAGKTTVCQLFKELGAYVISADEIVHQLLSPGTDVAQQVVKLLGSTILSNGVIDRKKVSELVFSHPEQLRMLEKIVHPRVFDEIDRNYEQVKREGRHPLFIAEIPLLYEAEREKNFDAVISVYADPERCQERFMQEHTEREFKQRMSRQLDPHIKCATAHYMLYNNGTIEELRAQVQTLFNNLSNQGVSS